MTKEKWEIVHECDLDDGTPTEWAIRTKDGRYYWIDLIGDGTYDVVGFDATSILKNCKSLASAKRWVTMNILN